MAGWRSWKALYVDRQGLCSHARLVVTRHGRRDYEGGWRYELLGEETVRGWGRMDGECVLISPAGGGGQYLVKKADWDAAE